MKNKSYGVIGAGSWGTALVKIFSENRKYGNSKYYSRIFYYLKILKLLFIV